MNIYFVLEKIGVDFFFRNSLERLYFFIVNSSIFRVIKFLNVFLMVERVFFFV